MAAAPGPRRNLLKIIVLGDSGVGKTCILKRFVDDIYSESHSSTIGADLLVKTIDIDGASITLQIWDTAGQERFRSLGESFFKGADGCLFVYDITDEDSFNNIAKWRKTFVEKASDMDAVEFKLALLGNKSDLSGERAVDLAKGQEYASQNNMSFFETSAKEGTGLREAFIAVADAASLERQPTGFVSAATAVKIDVEAEKADPGVCAC